MNTGFVKTAGKARLSLKAQTLAAAAAVAGTVVLPQFFHAAGAAVGAGTALGEVFLPMHLPIILVGLLAGPFAGAVSGLLGPLASFALSGMPGAAMLPFMMIELCAYGLFAGLLCNGKMPTLAKVALTQIAGRAVRAAAILIAVYALGNEAVRVSAIWLSIRAGMYGLALQWILLPLIVSGVERLKRNEG